MCIYYTNTHGFYTCFHTHVSGWRTWYYNSKTSARGIYATANCDDSDDGSVSVAVAGLELVPGTCTTAANTMHTRERVLLYFYIYGQVNHVYRAIHRWACSLLPFFSWKIHLFKFWLLKFVKILRDHIIFKILRFFVLGINGVVESCGNTKIDFSNGNPLFLLTIFT